MAQYERLAPRVANSQAFGSVATNGSSNLGAFCAPVACEIVGARLVNASGAAVTSGTTTGSAVTITVYKNGSNASSKIASFNGSGTTVATNTSQSLTMTTTTSLKRLAAGDIVTVEYLGGAANNASNANAYVSIEYVTGYEDGATPSAGTGPA